MLLCYCDPAGCYCATVGCYCDPAGCHCDPVGRADAAQDQCLRRSAQRFNWTFFLAHSKLCPSLCVIWPRRNYIMNRQQGLVIRAYKRAHLNRHKDKELKYLAK